APPGRGSGPRAPGSGRHARTRRPASTARRTQTVRTASAAHPPARPRRRSSPSIARAAAAAREALDSARAGRVWISVERCQEAEDRSGRGVPLGETIRKVRREDLVVAEAPPKHDVLPQEHPGERVVLRISRWEALQLFVGVSIVEPGDERLVLERVADPVGIVAHGIAKGVKARLLHLPHAATDEHLARLEVEVATVAVDALVMAAAGLRSGRILDPRERGAQVALVR